MKFLENVATIEGNAVFEETVKMSVDNDSLPFIIKSLTEMYSNPVLAMSREYISNAYDAVVARMGSKSSFGTVLDSPIEVTLPTTLNPNFVIRDYGTGMNREVLAKVFPKYGASTKRENNTEVGGFGLGAKSALAVVSNFTVVSVKDGKKNTGIVQKNADGVGEISFLPEVETNEPSGTTVTINLPDSSALNSIFRDSNLLIGFPHGSILLNGKMHEKSVFNTDLFTKIGEDGYVINSLLDWGRNNGSYYHHQNRVTGWGNEKLVVVGPISYRVSLNDLMGGSYSRDEVSAIFDAASSFTVLNLPIGSVDFTPARENLIFSDRTRTAIIETSKRLSEGVQKFAQASVSEAVSKKEAARRADSLRMNGFTLDWTYNGEEIPSLSISSVRVEGKKAWVSNRNSKVTPVETELVTSNDRTPLTVVVTGVTSAEQAKTLNRLRKPFADRYKPAVVHQESLTVLYMEAGKEELSSWAESLLLDIFTAEEWEEKGVTYRKEINAERRAKRAANASAKVINSGSTPVGVINIGSAYRSERPKIEGAYASDIASADTVVYVQVNNDKPASMSNKFAKTLSSAEDDGIPMASLNAAFNAVSRHFGQDKKRVRIVRVPANTKLETFLKAVPHAISMDEALNVVAESITEDKENTLALYMAKSSRRFAWIDSLDEEMMEKIENEEAREFFKKAHEINKSLTGYGRFYTSNTTSSNSDLVFAESFDNLFAEHRKTVKNANKFPLPLLEDMGSRYVKAENAVHYINLMYPVAA